MRHVYVSLDKKINVVFTDYRDIKFKLTAHRLGSENRNTVLWNKNYRNTAPKITQYRNTANPYAPLEEGCKGMFSILCMHFFIAYQARAIDVNQRFLVLESSFSW